MHSLLAKSTVVILYLAYFAATVLGCHLRKDLVEIQNDTIVLVHASSMIDSASGHVVRVPSSPSGGPDGTNGLVYNMPDPENCQPIPRSKEFLANSYVRIALISDGRCPMEIKVKQALLDGAVGALVFNATTDTLSTAMMLDSRLNRIKEKATIPIMAVDSRYGETLQLEVATLQEESLVLDSPQGSHRAIFASMYSEGDNERLSVWEITLIIMVVILAICFTSSIAFHVFTNRRQRHHHRYTDSDDTNSIGGRQSNLSKPILTLPSCALDRLMLRTISKEDVEYMSEYTSPLDSIMNPVARKRSQASSISKESPVCAVTSGSITASNEKEEGCGRDLAVIETECSVLQGCIATCIVCIDDFVVGSKMRILPCGHNYHIECIDPWLTTKSSLCPLCKYDTREILTDLERSYSGPRILADPHDLDELIDGVGSSSFAFGNQPVSSGRPLDISRRLWARRLNNAIHRWSQKLLNSGRVPGVAHRLETPNAETHQHQNSSMHYSPAANGMVEADSSNNDDAYVVLDTAMVEVDHSNDDETDANNRHENGHFPSDCLSRLNLGASFPSESELLKSAK